MIEKKFNQSLFVLTLLLGVPLTGVCIDIFVPSLPAMQHHFNTSKTLVQFTVPIYLFSLGIAQLFFGPLSDSIGRRRIYILGWFLVGLCSILITFSTTITYVLLLRFLQGIFVAMPGVAVRAILADVLEAEELRKKSYLVTIIWAMGPIVAPFIGGYLQHYFGWHAPFYFLAVYCFFIFTLACLFIPETLPAKKPLQIDSILSAYRYVLKNKIFIGGLVIAFMVYGVMSIFNVVGPFIVQVLLHKSAIVYGNLALLLGVSWLFGVSLNRVLFVRFTPQQLIITALWLFVVASAFMLVLSMMGYINLIAIMLPIYLLFMVGAIAFSNSFAECMMIFDKHKGTASAVMGAMILAGGSVMSVVGSLLKTSSQTPLAVIYLLIGVVSLVLFYKVLQGASRN